MVEVVIVMVIVGILMSIAIPSFTGWLANIRAAEKAESILGGLQFARIEALKRNLRVSFTLSSNASWIVGCVTPVGDNDGDGVDDCPASIRSVSASEGGTASVTLTQTLTDGSVATTSTATFSGVGTVSSLNADGSSPLAMIDAQGSGVTKPMRILLSAGGQSRLCDPAVTVDGDPKKC